MNIIITGANGKMGRAISNHLPSGSIIRVDRTLGTELFDVPRDTDADTIIHLASDRHNGEMSLAMTLHMLKFMNVKRFIYASSIMVEPACGLSPKQQPQHVADKKSGEAFIEAWTHDWPERIGIALRLGHYTDPGVFWDEENEALRLTQRGLLWWIDRALSHQVEGFTRWIVMGDGGADKRNGFRASDNGDLTVSDCVSTPMKQARIATSENRFQTIAEGPQQ